MNKEVLFAQTLEQVRKTAKEQGNCISEEQVKEAFAELDLSNEQLQMVFDYLLKHKIGIGQPMDPDEFLTEEEKDYLQEYLDEVAALPTYSDGEKLAFSIAAMAGETDAQQRLIELHLADVAEIAKLYAGQGVLLEDLVGEGNLALSFGVTMLGSLEKCPRPHSRKPCWPPAGPSTGRAGAAGNTPPPTGPPGPERGVW